MDSACSILIEIGKCLYDPLKRHMGYIIHCQRDVTTLVKKLDELEARRTDVRREVEMDQGRGHDIREIVLLWLKNVESAKEEISMMGDGVKNIKGVMGRLKKFRFCYKLGKEAVRMIATVEELQRKDLSSDISLPQKPPSTEDYIPIGDFMPFESTLKCTNDILDALKDVENQIVCVYGMGGVGKTTLIKQVGRKAKEERIFDKIVMVTVSKDVNVKNIQTKIYKQLVDSKIEEDDQYLRAAHLLSTLKRTSSILIILDDLWKRLDLSKVGIPYKSEHKGCKIAITTRYRHVCNSMDSQKDIPVGVLSYKESLVLFKSKAGEVVDTLEETLTLDVVKECGGLPLAIITLGRALRGRPSDVWERALKQMRMADPSCIPDMTKEVFESLKLSFEFLETDEKKLCFLFCCLFPEDYNIRVSDLMRFVLGEGLLKGCDTLEVAKIKVRAIYDELKDSCLVMEGDYEGDEEEGYEEEGYVRLHDVIRDFAIWMASRDSYGFVVRSGTGLTGWPDVEKDDLGYECRRISLMQNEIANLPQSPPECPRLLALTLSRNWSLENIPDEFFCGMKGLVVLDLSDTGISSLPKSLTLLSNLKCLDLSDTSISSLPMSLTLLSNLKCLDLTHVSTLETIPPNVLSSLSQLQQLYMKGSFRDWEVEGGRGGGIINNASFAELACLPRLAALEVDVASVDCLVWDCLVWDPSEKLSRFFISVGITSYQAISRRYQAIRRRYTRHVHIEGQTRFPHLLKLLVSRTWSLRLRRCGGFNDISELSADSGLNNLKELRLVSCHQLQCLHSHDEGGISSKTFLRNLQRLHLNNMGGLTELVKGPLPDGFFTSLKSVKLYECYKMANVMSSDLLIRARYLEELEVDRCFELQELFQYEEGVLQGQALLPQLKRISISILPQLTTLWKGEVPSGSLGSLKSLQIYSCDRLRCLLSPTQARALGQLEELKMGYCWQVERIISREREETTSESHENVRGKNIIINPPSVFFFPNLRRLVIGYIGSLKSLLSWRLAQGLVQLEELHIDVCYEMEAVIVTSEEQDGDDVVEENARKRVFPRLKILKLIDLPKLTSFSSMDGGVGVTSFDLPALEYLTVSRCPNLKKLPLGPQSSPKLKKIILRSKENEEEDKEWIKALEWEDEQAKQRFECLVVHED